MVQCVAFLFALLAVAVQAFVPVRFSSSAPRPATVLKMMPLTDMATSLQSLLLALEEAKPDDYVYGAVAAPDFALPLGAVLIISIAAVPALLSGGEKALDQQRMDEETRGVKFGRKNKSDDV